MCDTRISMWAPKSNGDYKEVNHKCGDTWIYGKTEFCEECENKHSKQGHRPNECIHGVNKFDDRPCNACEFDF